MRITLPPLEVGDHEGFMPEKDLFGRAELGNGLSNIVSQVEEPLVIALDGAWGSGKTTFLKMWAGELRKAKHPVVYFDAFENDYVEDAFAALARELVELAEQREDEASVLSSDFKRKAVKLGSMLLRGAAKVGYRATVRAVTAGTVSADDLLEVADDVAGEVEGVADHYMEQMLASPRQQREIVDGFRKALEELPGLLSPRGDGEDQKPLIYIIDELDRCKPVFALALLERIKHFMSVPNVHFVLGVNMRQLESLVKFAYGSDVDANLYLQKFVKIFIGDIKEGKSSKNIQKYCEYIRESLEIPRTEMANTAVLAITRLLKHHGRNFRSAEKALAHLALIVAFRSNLPAHIGSVVGGLIVMKLLSASLFEGIKNGSKPKDEIKKFLSNDVDENENESISWDYLMEDIHKIEELTNSEKWTYNSWKMDSRFDLTSLSEIVVDGSISTKG